MWWVLLVAGLLVWAGASLLIGAWIRSRNRPDLAERLLPYCQPTLPQEAAEWLRQQG